MTEIWFIRHGESVSNAGGITASSHCIPLTETGTEQARGVSLAVDQTPALIVTSPYIRTLLTAQPTLDRFPGVRHETWDVHEFTYLPLDAYVGTTIEQRRPLRDLFWQQMDPAFTHGGGAESFSGFLQRARDLIDRLKGEKTGPVLVFSHGIFLHAVRRLAAEPLSSDAALMQDFIRHYHDDPIDNCRILKAHIREDALHFLPGDAPPRRRDGRPDMTF